VVDENHLAWAYVGVDLDGGLNTNNTITSGGDEVILPGMGGGSPGACIIPGGGTPGKGGGGAVGAIME